jgi:Zn-dependent peptidase ImmA (M78 family)
MPLSTTQIEKLASKVLAAVGASKAPIPVELVARRLGLAVKANDFTDDVSGVLVIEEGSGTIGYNEHHAEVRQRFTIAHEIGHYQLHKSYLSLFVDKGYSVAYRDKRSSTGEIRWEREANAFAAALLMPKELLTREVQDHDFDLGDERSLDELSKLFGVSTQAMAIRLSKLKLI